MLHKDRLLRSLIVTLFVAVSAVACDDMNDSIAYLERSFPGGVKLAEGKRSIEFCPDNTCDGFQARRDVPISELKDFAYLYVFHFSDYSVLREWRTASESRAVSADILSKSKYQKCGSQNTRTVARCVLQALSRGNRIELTAIRYDEKRRVVTRKDISVETSITKSSS